MKVLITVKISDEQLEKIKSLGYEIIRYVNRKIKNCEEVDDADILVTYNPFKRLDISENEKFKIYNAYKCRI